MKYKEHRQWFLSALKGDYSDREGAQLYTRIMQYLLKVDRVQLKLMEDQFVPNEVIQKSSEVMTGLNKDKPIDYILGETTFFGYTFKVDESVLIPRPETEELVLMVLEYEKEKGLDVLDIGTGSGCIPIALSKENIFRNVDACDISQAALNNAILNARNIGAEVNFFKLDILNNFPATTYDVVISNPPYVKREELDQLQKKVVEYEPIIALSPEGDPLIFYKHMMKNAARLLRPEGRFYWEIHEDMGEIILELLHSLGFAEIELKKDFYDRDRFIRAVYKQ